MRLGEYSLRRLGESVGKIGARLAEVYPLAAEIATGDQPRLPDREVYDGYSCPACGDSGWRRLDRQPGEPGFGDLVECGCEAGRAVRQKRQDRVWQSAGIPPKFAKYSLDTLARVTGKETLAERLEKWRRTRHWLVLSGPPGTCKSGSAASLLTEHQAEGGHGMFVILPSFLDRLRATFGAGEDQPGYLEALRTVCETPLLVLDDVGVNGKPLTDWGKEQVFQVVNYRDLNELQTVFTTNLDMTPFRKFVGEPTWDRIVGRLGKTGWIVSGGDSQRGLDL